MPRVTYASTGMTSDSLPLSITRRTRETEEDGKRAKREITKQGNRETTRESRRSRETRTNRSEIPFRIISTWPGFV